MKEKIFAAIMTLIVLASTTNLWLTYKGKITFFTNLKPETKVSLQYAKNSMDNLISITKQPKPDGRISFEIEEKEIFYFKGE